MRSDCRPLARGGCPIFPNASRFLAFPSSTQFFRQTSGPLFPFCGNAKGKREHEKFWKRIGAGGDGKNLFQTLCSHQGVMVEFYQRFIVIDAARSDIPLRVGQVLDEWECHQASENYGKQVVIDTGAAAILESL